MAALVVLAVAGGRIASALQSAAHHRSLIPAYGATRAQEVATLGGLRTPAGFRVVACGARVYFERCFRRPAGLPLTVAAIRGAVTQLGAQLDAPGSEGQPAECGRRGVFTCQAEAKVGREELLIWMNPPRLRIPAQPGEQRGPRWRTLPGTEVTVNDIGHCLHADAC